MSPAEREFLEARRRWAKQLEPQLAIALNKRPGAWAAYYLLRATKSYQATQAQGAKGVMAVQSEVFQALLKTLEEPGWKSIIRLEADCGRNFDLISPWSDGPSGFAETIARVFKIDMPAAPKLDIVVTARRKP